MQVTASIALAFYAIWLQQVVATPISTDIKGVDPETLRDTTGIVARAGAGDSQSDPIEAELTIKNKSKLAFEADCWAILCKDAPDVLQRVNHERDKENRRDSGACATPFKNQQARAIPKQNPAWGKDEFVSPEEYPFASSLQGGTDSYLIPVNLEAQRSQGGVLKQYLTKNKIKQFDPNNPGSSQGTWYKIKFTGDLGPYCQALANNDKSVCDPNKDVSGEWGYDPAKFVYQYDKATKTFKYVGK